jgi:SAM-dependent methyltransferase
MLYQNPDLYDTLLPASRDQLRFYLALARRPTGAILELACGSGQLTVPIAAQGLPVVGLDSSPEMLTAARRRALAAGIEVEFFEGDMRTFDLGRRFSTIFIARNSLLHLSEQDEFAALFQPFDVIWRLTVSLLSISSSLTFTYSLVRVRSASRLCA